MTNHWTDIENADVILVMGSNAAENHPISFKWVTKAKEKGGTLISVDPRFTRTSSKADIFAPIRSGADIAFLGGMINYIIENKRDEILRKGSELILKQCKGDVDRTVMQIRESITKSLH